VSSPWSQAAALAVAPVDFLAFHAKGQTEMIDGHVRMGISAQLRTIDEGFRKITAVDELKSKAIVLGESDPEGCAACRGPQVGYRNGTLYASYTAASLAREHLLADRYHANFEGAVTWAFEFEDQPYFPGFRALASNGIDLPVLNVFRMLARMSGQRLMTRSSSEVPLDEILASSVRKQPDVAAFASIDGQRLYAMVWHYRDDDIAGPDALVTLNLKGLGRASGTASVTHYRIDESHSNAYALWQRLGSPVAPNDSVYAQLLKAGELATLEESAAVSLRRGAGKLAFALPRQGVSLLVIDWRNIDK
jgi:xylan 1,4-beta-xylosidase